MTPYEELEARFTELGHLSHARAMLNWDEASMMPVGGGAVRGEAMAVLAGIAHQKLTDPELSSLLDQAEGSNERLDEWQQANVREMRRNQRRACAVPETLVRALQLTTARCEQTWRRARQDNDWSAVSGLLEDVLGLVREEAQALGEALSLAPYDALLDGYEADTRAAQVSEVFDDLKGFLPRLLEQVVESQTEPVAIAGRFSVERQRALGEAMMRALGFDFEHGRLDVSHHPFCGGVPDDTRITTRYNEHDFLESLMAVLHETGHALYQQGLPASWRHQPVGRALGAAVHESQSLFVEMQVARGRPFMTFAAPHIRRHLDGSDDDAAWSVDNLFALATRVRPGYIRVDADEVTYPLHIILRFELEKALIAGEMSVSDIPDAWNEYMSRHLGLSTVGNFKDGCMQDVHWFAGLFGYFPTYTLGALTAAQWFAAARSAIGGLEEQIQQGHFAPLVDWLRVQVHRRGRLKSALELLTEVTGEPLSTDYFKAHLRGRYLPN
jgi:carboxypeptidase Taq